MDLEILEWLDVQVDQGRLDQEEQAWRGFQNKNTKAQTVKKWMEQKEKAEQAMISS